MVMRLKIRPRSRNAVLACLMGAVSIWAAVPAGAVSPAGPDQKPYDEKLMRLAELLGAIHFLRELCGANDGQYWRERMEELWDLSKVQPPVEAAHTK